MGRKKKTIHYLYKTTCNITGRYYYGMHSTSNIDDGYLGSGKILRYSVRKYGKDNHTKEILSFYDSREELCEAEKVIITEELIQDSVCMNLTEGGSGGNGARYLSKEQLQKGGKKAGNIISDRMKNEPELRKKYSDNFIKIVKQAHSEGLIKPPSFKSMKHSEESKLKMSESKKGQGKGSTNSQYGSMWITNEVENRKIGKDSLIPAGWRRGRIIKIK